MDLQFEVSDSPGTTKVSVVPTYSVCIATFQRPEGLLNLLESLEIQQLGDGETIEILVVDNSPPSAKRVVDDFAKKSRHCISYFEQPEKNISLTRNLAVRKAKGEFVWFVDDDEVVVPQCLSLLAHALQSHDADGVYGPVLPLFESKHENWLETSSIFNRPVGVTGRKSTAHRTGNTLIRTEILRSVPGPFDPAFGISGGSDSMLFRQLADAGALFIDSSDAIAYELVPDSRADWGWMKNRSRRQGQNYARQVVMANNGASNTCVAWTIAKAAVQIPTMLMATALKRKDRSRQSEYWLRFWNNVGKFEGLAGAVSVREE